MSAAEPHERGHSMRGEQIQKLRTGALVAAVVLFGISWSFTLLRFRTSTYPLLWALSMPPLAFYYFSRPKRLASWKHLPAAAISIFAVVLWQVTRSYGLMGSVSTVAGVLLSGAGAWLGSRLSRPAASVVIAPEPVRPVRSKRARQRTAGARAAARH